MPYYINKNISGIQSVSSLGDGFSINIKWQTAYPETKTNKISYNIYVAQNPIDYNLPTQMFDSLPSYLVLDGNNIDLHDFSPEIFFFAVRATEYDPTLIDPTTLPIVAVQETYGTTVRFYPKSLLAANIGESDIVIPLIDVTDFPDSGVAKIGVELMRYTSIDRISNSLLLGSLANRGFFNTDIRIHDVDGYDGYFLQNPDVPFWLGFEEQNTKVYEAQSLFQRDISFAFNFVDGYRQRTADLLTSDLSGSDAFNSNFPTYPYSGYNSTSPTDLLNGECVGSYIGGESWCADGYSGDLIPVRGLNLQQVINQREEQLLNIDGTPCVLIRKMRTGIYCDCYSQAREQANENCEKCFGAGFISGWFQFFYNRRSDGRILVRFSPANEDIKRNDYGMESELITDAWTLTDPTVKDRDVLVRYDQDNNAEFRYEVLYVNRNNTINNLQGAQKMNVQRIRKTDPIYKIPVFDDTSMVPETIYTTFTSSQGIPNHSHTIVISSDKTIYMSSINEMTSVSQSHNHVIRNGIVLPALGHSHSLLVSLL